MLTSVSSRHQRNATHGLWLVSAYRCFLKSSKNELLATDNNKSGTKQAEVALESKHFLIGKSAPLGLLRKFYYDVSAKTLMFNDLLFIEVEFTLIRIFLYP